MPGIARTQQYVKEQLGQVDDKVSRPLDTLSIVSPFESIKSLHIHV